MTTTPAQRCKRCAEKAGLSILLVRPTAIAIDPDFAPANAADLKTHEPSAAAFKFGPMKKSRFALRMLRQRGFVYAYDTNPPSNAHSWKAYRVHASGVLIEVDLSAPMDEEVRFSCNLQPTHPHDLRTLRVQLPQIHPEKAAPVWIGFSMNWWDDNMRARVLRDPSAAGMVRIDPLAALGGVAHAFEATPELIEQYVADFAIPSNAHDADNNAGRSGAPATGGLEPDWPLYSGPADKTYKQANDLCQVMEAQAARHPLTRGRQFVLALPDPVGYVADLNAIRLAKARAHARAWQKEELAWPKESYERLQSVRTIIMVQAASDPENQRSDRTLSHDPARPVPRELAQRRGERLGEQWWSKITDQLDKASFEAWPAKQAGILERQAAERLAYENDWLDAWALDRVNTFGASFKNQYDPNDPASPKAVFSCGRIYAGEANVALYPQPTHPDLTEKWLLATAGGGLHDESRAMAMRAIFGNQNSVIELAYDFLVGEGDRSGPDGDWRDKTYNLIKGVLETDLGKKVGWLHPTVMAFSCGAIAAMAGATFQLARSAMGKPPAPDGRLLRYQERLPRLMQAQQNLDYACEAAAKAKGSKTLPKMAVLLQTEVDVETAKHVLYGKVKDKKARRQAGMVVREGKVKLLTITDLDTALAVQQGKVAPASIPNQRVEVNGRGAAAQSLKALRAQAAKLSGPLTPDQIQEVFAHRHARAELNLSDMNSRLAVGAIVVQGLGMIQSAKTLMDELTKAHGSDPAVLKNAALGTVDGAAGVVGSMAELLAAQETARLIVKDTSGKLVQASSKMAMLRSTAGLTNVLGAGITVYLLMGSREKAAKEGDVDARDMYLASMSLIGTSVVPQAFVATDAAMKGALSRAIAVRLAGALATTATVEALAGTVAALVVGAGWFLLLAGVGTALWAAMSERNELQRWAGRSHFGIDTAKRYRSSVEEDVTLSLILEPGGSNESDAEAQRLRSHPVPRASISPPSNPLGDGWGGGLQ